MFAGKITPAQTGQELAKLFAQSVEPSTAGSKQLGYEARLGGGEMSALLPSPTSVIGSTALLG